MLQYEHRILCCTSTTRSSLVIISEFSLASISFSAISLTDVLLLSLADYYCEGTLPRTFFTFLSMRLIDPMIYAYTFLSSSVRALGSSSWASCCYSCFYSVSGCYPSALIRCTIIQYWTPVCVVDNRIDFNNKVLTMWKNQTTPNLHNKASTPILPASFAKPSNTLKLGQLSFAETEPIKTQTNILSGNNGESFQFCSRSSKANESGHSSLSFNMGGKINKEHIIVMELQENQQLRLNLFRAEKTIQDLDALCKDMQQGIRNSLLTKNNQIIGRLNEGKGKAFQNKGKGQAEKENRQGSPLVQQKQIEITELWKACHTQMLEYVSNYTKDIALLIDEYKDLEAKNEGYRKNKDKSKKNEKNLLKILKQSSIKLQRSQQTIEKAIEDLRQRDIKIEQYQIENKNIKMKIMEYLEQIERLKRENKANIRDGLSFKQVAKSLQQQVNEYARKCQELQLSLQNKIKSEQIYKDNEDTLKERMKNLQEELIETKKFNENLMDEYKKLTIKIENNEQKLCQRYQASQSTYQERIKQQERLINTIRREKQLLIEKNEHKMVILEQELEKTYKIKASLQKQLTERSIIISNLSQELAKAQERHSIVELELNGRIQQKQKQVGYLEEIKNLGVKQNEQLKQQLEDMRTDMVVIIEQLKIKELQVEKYSHYSNQFFAQASPKLISAHIKEQTDKDSLQQVDQSIQSSGIVWRKTKKGRQSVVSQNGHEQLYDEVPTEKMVKNATINQYFKKIQDCHSIDHKENVPQLLPIEQSENESEEMEKSIQNFTPKSRFNLQAFQNKLIMEENAKLFFHFNKTIFK